MRLILALLLFTLAFHVEASIDFKLGGGLDKSFAEDGDGIKTRNYGFSGETALAFSFFEPLYLGIFGYKGLARTSDVISGSGVDNFYISSQGGGAELGLRFYSVMVRVGIGHYDGEARKVQDSVGRTYSLSGGQGYHIGIEKRFALGPMSNWYLGLFSREITYSKIKIKDGDSSYVDLPQKWQQRIYSLFLGVAFNFDIISGEQEKK